MIPLRITLRKLREGKELPDLIISEFMKLKRKKITVCIIASACLFPIPVSIMVIANSYNMKNIFAMLVQLGDCFMMPLVLGFLAMILFYMERDNDTLKNMLLISMSPWKILYAKIVVIMVISLLYSAVVVFISCLIGGVVGDILGIGIHFITNLWIGFFMCAALMPVIAFVISGNRNYIITGIVIFLFVFINFIFVMSITELPLWALPFLPIAVIYRFFLPQVAVQVTVYVENIALSAWQFITSMIITVLLSGLIIVGGFRKKYLR